MFFHNFGHRSLMRWPSQQNSERETQTLPYLLKLAYVVMAARSNTHRRQSILISSSSTLFIKQNKSEQKSEHPGTVSVFKFNLAKHSARVCVVSMLLPQYCCFLINLTAKTFCACNLQLAAVGIARPFSGVVATNKQ